MEPMQVMGLIFMAGPITAFITFFAIVVTS